ncbi:lipopolysaccharide export system ATP-binding protein [Geothermobacter ehrlichii]|uniref:Lipopolysaccharide export system ATP-binding protein n=1 Tax=Geothermobacter ehrlichii TaxID=213224 RepID=A0A5D3WN64_9BACT|nr:LPS export ABC transporter ATP-binding protein [Geothermobacter ehrlichii]TYO99508.1 lipopolysaccharide export system ATP-binding protein [Geothermobacter ehrlichii]
MAKTLRAEKLCKTYQRRQVVKNVDLEVSSGQVIGLLGPNGAGKTTSFYMVVGLVKPDSGRVFLDDRELTEMPMYRRARSGISYLPQEASVFRKLTVEENLLAILETLDLSREQQQQRKRQLLEDLRLTHVAASYGYALSGGERRRLEIARALVIEPDFILLDEPFAGIDPLAVIDIQNIIRHLRENGIGILISDHNVRETLGVCDRAYILNEGEVLEYGTPEEIAASERAREIYLGDKFRL